MSAQALSRGPVNGRATKDGVNERFDSKYYFVFGLVGLLAALVYTFGYPLLICLALLGTASGLAFLIALTASDAFTKARAPAPNPALRTARNARR